MTTPLDSERALRAAFPRLAATAEGELGQLAREATRHSLAAGEVVLVAGAPQNALYLVCEGRVQVEVDPAGANVSVGTLGPSTWFGELGFLHGGLSTATVKASEPTLLLSVTHDQLLAYMETRPRIAEALLRELIPGMARRLRETRGLMDRGLEPLKHADPPMESRISRAFRALFGGAA